MDAMIRTGPPHLSHFSISMANTRLSRCAHPNAARSRVGLGFRALLFFYRFLRNNVFTQFAVGRKAAPREHTMKPREVDPWSGHQRCQAPHEFHWTEWGRLRTTCEVPSSYGVFKAMTTLPLLARDNRLSAMAGRVM